MNTKKIVVVGVLVLIGLYWIFDHSAPLPFNHDSFGLHQHTLHRIVGVVFLIVAGAVWWKWKAK